MKTGKIFHKSMLCVLVLCFLITGVVGTNRLIVKAEKASVNCDNKMIAVNETYEVYVYDEKKNAKYTYSSSNKKVATVSKKGEVTGRKPGKAKITVKETYKKKTKKIGTVTITVKAAVIAKLDEESKNVINQTGYWQSKKGKEEAKWHLRVSTLVDYENEKATYKVYSSNTKRLKIKTDGTIQAASGTGEVTLTVKETYQKKTKTIGKVKVKVVKPTLAEKTLLLKSGDKLYADKHIKYKADFVYVWKNKTVTEEELKKDWERLAKKKEIHKLKDEVLEYDVWDRYIAKRTGTRYLYYGIKNYKKNTYETLGHIVVNVESINKADKVSMLWDKKEGVCDRETGYEMEAGQDAYVNFYTEPCFYVGEVEVEIEDEGIVSCEKPFRRKLLRDDDEYDEEDEENEDPWMENGVIVLHAKKPGVTNVTVRVNGASNTFKVNVYEERTYTTEQFNILTISSVIDKKEMIEETGEKGWRIESSNTEIATICEYSDGRCMKLGETQAIMAASVYVDTHDKTGEVTISAYYHDKLMGQKTIRVQ